MARSKAAACRCSPMRLRSSMYDPTLVFRDFSFSSARSLKNSGAAPGNKRESPSHPATVCYACGTQVAKRTAPTSMLHATAQCMMNQHGKQAVWGPV